MSFVIVLFAVAPGSAKYKSGVWAVSEFQPDIENGGRANSIAVHPSNNDEIIVSTPSGGLFWSFNGGVSWSHIDQLREFGTNGVKFLPSDPDVIIVTAGEDFKTSNGGGIWRSADGGTTWTHVSSPSAPSGVTDRFGAFEVSIAPDSGTIYVGTTYGVSLSTNKGVTWTHVDPFGGSDHRVFAVVAQSGNRVLAAGPEGIRFSIDGGSTWSPSSSGPSSIADMHALGASPYADDQAYVVDDNTDLYYTEDGGDHWTKISSSATGGGGCGGIAFVKAVGRTKAGKRFIDLYVGNRCALAKLSCPEILATTKFTYSGSWTTLKIDHADTRDLAFDNSSQPLLLATDGGLHETSDGGLTWTLVGGGKKGFNALQITEVKTQFIADLGRTDVYFGTQDNNLYASSDGGTTWSGKICCEGFWIERLHHVSAANDSHVTFVSCYGCKNNLSDPLFKNTTSWTNPTTGGTPTIVRKSLHVQGVGATSPYGKGGLAVTANLGKKWDPYAEFGESRRDIAKLAESTTPVLYQAIRTGYDSARDLAIDQLVRITGKTSGSGATVSYPAMKNFGGLGINPTMFAWYEVFGVDSANPSHVIAPDVVNEKMMETWDGGDSWTEIPKLTALVLDKGTFAFRLKIFPHVSAISFYHNDPNLVAIGTWEGGVFLSTDRGATWEKIPDSERIARITSIDWMTANKALVSSYGRGLWLINWALATPPKQHNIVCKPGCQVLRFAPLGDPAMKVTNRLLLFAGHIQGVKVAGGALKELFVSPGSSVVFFAESGPMRIKITETTAAAGFSGLRAPRAPKGMTMVGLDLDERGALVNATFTRKPLAMYEPSRRDREQPPLHEKSPVAGKPYLHLSTPADAANFIAPGKLLQLRGQNFPSRSRVGIHIDDRLYEQVAVGDDGEFTLQVPAPRETGLHRVTVRRQESGEVIDGAMFLVRPEERVEQ